MNIPTLLDNKTLATLAAPDETMAMRVIVRAVHNSKPYRIRGRLRHYQAEHDPVLNVHVLDVPVSLWMKDFPTGTYVQNPSIAHDIQGNRIGAGLSPLLFSVIPWPGAKPQKSAAAAATGESNAAPLEAFRRLADVMGAPPVIMSSIDLLSSGMPGDQVTSAIESTIASVEEELRKVPSPDPVAAAPRESNPLADALTSTTPPAAAESKRKLTGADRAKRCRERKALAKKAAKKAAAKKAGKPLATV